MTASNGVVMINFFKDSNMNLRRFFQLGNKNTSNELPKQPVKLIIPQNNKRAQKDILSWRNALIAAENVDNPRRYALIQLYKEIILDAHLSGQIELRKRRVLSSKFSVYDANNNLDITLTWALKQPAIQQIMEYILDAIFWGHSLIQIDHVEPFDNGKGGITSVTLIPREHVMPEKGWLLPHYYDTTGISYRDTFYPWLIETPDYSNLGLLSKTAPYVLYKRFALASWSEFAELFGSPMRIGKTNTRDTTMINRMYDMLKNMGSMAFGVFDKDEEINFIETARSNGEVFMQLIETCNAEISKLINGAVIGENTSEGSRAKEQVGDQIHQIITAADKKYLENVMNTIVFPILIQHGYPLDNCTFAFEEEKDLNNLWDITYQALQYYDIDEEWIKETFGIQIIGKKGEDLQNLSAFFQ